MRGVFLHVTRACNRACRYCYALGGTAAPDELTAGELRGLWPQLVASGVRRVVLTGGEPLVRPDLLELLRDLKDADPDHRMKRCLNTNGTLITPDLANRLARLVDEVRVSVDALEHRNDRLRGEGAHAAALEALARLRTAGFEPKVLVTVSSTGLSDLEALLRQLSSLGVRRVNLNPLRPIGRAAGRLDWTVPAADVERAVRGSGFAVEGLGPERGPGRPRSSCPTGRFINVTPGGDVYPCHVLNGARFLCGNVRRETIVVIADRIARLPQERRPDRRDVSGCVCPA